MTSLLPLEELNRIKSELIKNESVAGIFVYKEAVISAPDLETEMIFMVLVTRPDDIEAVRAQLAAIPDKPDFLPMIHAQGELNQADSVLLQRVVREGKLIYWNSTSDMLVNQVFRVKLHTMFTFELKKLQQIEKARFNYQIYGRKGSGLLETWEGKRITKSCFYVPFQNKFKVIRFLAGLEISYKTLEIWL